MWAPGFPGSRNRQTGRVAPDVIMALCQSYPCGRKLTTSKTTLRRANVRELVLFQTPHCIPRSRLIVKTTQCGIGVHVSGRNPDTFLKGVTELSVLNVRDVLESLNEAGKGSGEL